MVSDSEGTLDTIVAAIYDAVGDAARWRDALARITEAAGGFSATLIASDKQLNSLAFIAEAGGYPPEAVRLYNEYYYPMDQSRIEVHNGPARRLWLCHEVLDENYVRRSEYYNDFLIPMGGRYVAGSKVFDGPQLVANLGVHRNLRQGPFSESAAALLRSVIPHVQRAIQLHFRLVEAERRNDQSATALDQLSCGCLVVDGNSRVISANAAALALAAAGDGFALRDNRIVVGDSASGEALRVAIAKAALTAQGRCRDSGGTVAIHRRSARMPYAALVAPLTARAGATIGTPLAAAIVFIVNLEADAALPAVTLRRFFGLTRREANVAAELATGKSPEEIAAAAGLSTNTIRVQLRSIFRKTATSRQSELIRLMGKLPCSPKDAE